MRKAFVLLVVTFIASGFFVGTAWAEDAVPDLVFAGPSSSNLGGTVGEDRRLLPIRGAALPLSGMGDDNVQQATPQVSLIEAIPTPTAFNAGAVLLAAIFIGRSVRKFASRFVAAG